MHEFVGSVDALMRYVSTKSEIKKGVGKFLAILKNPVCTWNNQNFKIKKNIIAVLVLIEGKSKQISMKATITEYQ